MAEFILKHEVIARQDMIDLLGPRPHKEKSTYEDFVSGTGDEEEENLSLDEFTKRRTGSTNTETSDDDAKGEKSPGGV